MAYKTTPDKNRKKRSDSLNVSFEEDTKQQTIKTDEHGNKPKTEIKKTTIKPRDVSTSLVRTTNFMQNTSTMCQTCPPLSLTYTSVVPAMTTMSPYYPPFVPTLNYPEPHFNTIITTLHQPPIYPIPFPPVPVNVLTPPMFSTQVHPYSTMVTTPVYTEPMLPFATPTGTPTRIHMQNFEGHGFEGITPISPATRDSRHIRNLPQLSSWENLFDVDHYLHLPKDLFPTARMFNVDPNILIDALCKEGNMQNHASWILDIEFGAPRAPVTRPIAIFDVQNNSLHCKNNPRAIHPGFESCSQHFKKNIMVYYDSIISTWYRGFVTRNSDASIENFQYWLQVAMELFGMCWP